MLAGEKTVTVSEATIVRDVQERIVAGNKKKKKKKQRSGRDLKAREILKELSQKEGAVDAERQALEATWAERCRE